MYFSSLAGLTGFLTLGVLKPLGSSLAGVLDLGPPPPSADKFYAVPSNIAEYDQGAIIRYREPPSAIASFGLPLDLAKSYQILYRTTNGQGVPTATVVTVMIPPNADYNSIMSFQLAEDADTINCAPSYSIQMGSETSAKYESGTAQLELLIMIGALQEGWIVITPDFEGPDASYIDSMLAAHAVLDGISAVLASGKFTRIKPESVVTMYGYSGGASVTKDAAAIQPTYAEDLKLSGTVTGGLPTSKITKAMFDTLNQSNDSGLIPLLLVAVIKAAPQFKGIIDKHLKPQYKNLFYKPMDQCLDANLETFRGLDVKGFFDCWDCVIDPIVAVAGTAKETGNPAGPQYIYQSAADQLVDITQIDNRVIKYCDEGVNVFYQRNDNPHVNHVHEAFLGAEDALDWLNGIRNGTYPQKTCIVKRVKTDQFSQKFLSRFPNYISTSLFKLMENR